MKRGWNVKPLGDLCAFRPPKSEARDRLGDRAFVSFVPMSDLAVDEKYFAPKETAPLSKVGSSYTYFADGDVLLAKITPCFENGKLGIAQGLENGVGFGSSEFFVLRPSPVLDREFLYYFLSQPKVREDGQRQMGGAVGQQRVPKEYVERLQIPVPPLSEQRRIVAILDEAFEGIAAAKANAEQNLRNTKEVFEGHMAELFTEPTGEWESTTIGATIGFIDYRGKTPAKTEAGLRLITAKNVKMGRLLEEPAEYVAPSTYKSWMTRGIPKKGDILFTTEAPLANVAELDTDEKVVFAQRIIIMQPDEKSLHSPFLKYMLMSAPVQSRIHRQGTGATVKGIKSSLLKQIQIQFPRTLREQRRIAERLAAIEAASAELSVTSSQKLASLEKLKASLLHQAFSGAL